MPVSIQAEALSWKQQLGSSNNDYSEGVASGTNGSVYVSGMTQGSLAGTNNAGADAWVAKYDGGSTLLWKKQLGLFGPDVSSNGVAADSMDNVYISGYTLGSLGASNQGLADAWIAKYNYSGVLVWKRQLGTSSTENSLGVATDSLGNVYISGYTSGALAGANRGGSDAWVAKYNSGGVLVWKRQLGSSGTDVSCGVATDSKGNVYISGSTTGSLAGTYQGEEDAFVAKYNSSGTLLWDRQLGTPSGDLSYDVTTDSVGNVYISGDTGGSLAKARTSFDADAFVAKYSTTGKLVWKQQLGSLYDHYDISNGVAINTNGDVYISGDTYGSLGGAPQGGSDAWVVKYTQ